VYWYSKIIIKQTAPICRAVFIFFDLIYVIALYQVNSI